MHKPRRIQLKRTKGFKLPPNTVVVSRPSLFGNPHRVTPALIALCGGNRLAAQKTLVDSFRDYLNDCTPGQELKPIIRAKLRGKNLACWCSLNEPCHADVLLKVANPKKRKWTRCGQCNGRIKNGQTWCQHCGANDEDE